MTAVPPRARAAALLASALLMTTAGCDDDGDAPSATIDRAWQEPAAYTYTLESSGGERSLIGTFRVTVRDGVVAEAEGLDDSARRLVDRSPDQVPTIGDLLDEVERAREENADQAEVAHAADGHPERITLDWMENAIDDEALYVISDYTPGAG
ncbi:DUF6174 domain-containing protein [Streptomyces sp. NPDC048002]|uniref:DUF6174 domain-containing protein n=1 Tax=Streptomyces sp. NPDC048002 TaxID=3154344 RepID=UPI00340EA3E8